MKHFDESGFSLLSNIFNDQSVDAAICAIDTVHSRSVHQRRGKTYAIRNVLEQIDEVRHLAGSPEIRGIVEAVLGRGAFVARSLLFDKTAVANWKVPWHQDVTIAVKERIDAAGFGPWSVKDGVLHTEAPAYVLDRMLTLRVHLDDCDGRNGALRVLPGTHKFGKLDGVQIEECRRVRNEVVCELPRGGVMLMRPLLLHASSPALNPEHRRVIQLEFAAEELPDGLTWANEGLRPTLKQTI